MLEPNEHFRKVKTMKKMWSKKYYENMREKNSFLSLYFSFLFFYLKFLKPNMLKFINLGSIYSIQKIIIILDIDGTKILFYIHINTKKLSA